MSTDNQTLIPAALEYLSPAECDYNEWLAVGMALHAEGYSISTWDDWSRRDAPGRYNQHAIEQKWRGFGNQARIVRGGTIVKLAIDKGFRPTGNHHYSRPVRMICPVSNPKSSSLDASGMELNLLKDLPDRELENPVPDATPPVVQLGKYLDAVFRSGDIVAFCRERDSMAEPGFAGSLTVNLCEGINTIPQYLNQDGCFIMVNPYDGGERRKVDNITSFRNALIESDSVSLEEQLQLMLNLRLPCRAIVYSGNKSYHAVIAIDAANANEYAQRIRFTMEVCKAAGLEPDQACKNANRLTRLPGAMRGGQLQRLVSTGEGFKSWTEWRSWIAYVTRYGENVTKRTSLNARLGGAISDPVKSPTLIQGILRYGHKMIMTSSGKAGKTFLMLELAIAVVLGREWLGFQCSKNQVLFIDPELDPNSFEGRMHDVCSAMHLTDDELQQVETHLYHSHMRGSTVDIASLADMVCDEVEFGSVGLVVIDSIFKLFDGDENKSSDVKSFMAHVDRINKVTGAAVAMSHHTGKGAKGDMSAIERGRGSSVWGDDPDAPLSLIEIFPPKDEPGIDGVRAFMLEDSGLREFPSIEPLHILWDYPIHRIDTEGLTEDWKPRTNAQIAGGKGGEASGKARGEKSDGRWGEAEKKLMSIINSFGPLNFGEAAEIAGYSAKPFREHLAKSDYLEREEVSKTDVKVVLKKPQVDQLGLCLGRE